MNERMMKDLSWSSLIVGEDGGLGVEMNESMMKVWSFLHLHLSPSGRLLGICFTWGSWRCMGCGERLRRRKTSKKCVKKDSCSFARSGRVRPPDQARNGARNWHSLARPMTLGCFARSG